MSVGRNSLPAARQLVDETFTSLEFDDGPSTRLAQVAWEYINFIVFSSRSLTSHEFSTNIGSKPEQNQLISKSRTWRKNNVMMKGRGPAS
jgi:hypothetical protein